MNNKKQFINLLKEGEEVNGSQKDRRQETTS